MGTTISGMGMVVSSGDAAAESDKKSRPANGLGPGLDHADFFAANGISPPSSYRRDIADRIRADDLAVMESGVHVAVPPKAPLRNKHGLLAPAVALATGPVLTMAAGKLQGVSTVGVDNVAQAVRIPAGASLQRKAVQ
jgi:hypothetical protein